MLEICRIDFMILTEELGIFGEDADTASVTDAEGLIGTKIAPDRGGDTDAILVAGAGFEPATFWL